MAGRRGYKADLRTRELLMRCESILIKALQSPKIDDKEKRTIALELYKKGMPNNVMLSGNVNHRLSIDSLHKEYDDYLSTGRAAVSRGVTASN